MTGNLKLLSNFVEQFLGMVKFGNDQIAPILGYGDLENDRLMGFRGTDLYSITFQETSTSNPICLMAKATSSQVWLWHRRLLHLNFDTINLLSKYDIVIGLPKLKFIKDHLCSSYELGKAKRYSFKTKTNPSKKRRLQILHMDLCGPMRVENFNDETPEVLIDFLKIVQRGLHAQVRTVQTDKGTKFLNKTIHAYFAQEGIEHQTLTARTPKQNGVVKRRNPTLVEAARTMLSATKKPSVKFFHIFGSLCYIVRDGKNLDKMKEKDHVSSDPVPQCQRTALEHDSLSPVPQCQENVPYAAGTVTTSNELDFLFTPTVTSIENINQAETITKNAQVKDDEFINIFCTLVQDRGETSSRHVDSSNIHTFYQRHPSEHRWMKDHPLEQVIRNPSQSVRTRRQLESDGEMCMFALTMSQTEPKNIKEAMTDSAWIESM
nr:hypothetical protein [Tanacetum cinerariifolium]